MRRLALVTGGSSGIGAAIALALARRGWDLLLVARRRERLDAVADAARASGATVEASALDVRDGAAVRAWAEGCVESLRELSLLVNNAGLARGLATVQEGEVADWDEMLDTNVKGLLHVTRAVLPHMIARGAGDVVNIGSVAGHRVYPKGVVYCASKAAERVITEGLRMDLLGTGVRCCTVDPGLVEDTEFSLVRFHGDEARAGAVYRGTRPLKAEDVAEAVAWVVERPPHVNVAELVVYPTDQAAPTMVHRRD